MLKISLQNEKVQKVRFLRFLREWTHLRTATEYITTVTLSTRIIVIHHLDKVIINADI